MLAEVTAILVVLGGHRPRCPRRRSHRPGGNTEAVGWLLYTDYLVPFEVASMLLLAAMVGAIVLARKEAE